MDKTIQLEYSVLGSLMSSATTGMTDDIIDIILDLRSVKFTGRNQVIANAIYELNQSAKPIDVLSVMEKVESMGYDISDNILGMSSAARSASTAKHHFNIIKQRTLDETVRKIANQVEEVSNSRLEPTEKLAKLETLISNTNAATPSQMSSLGDAAKEWMDRHERMLNSEGEFLRSTGFEGIDNLLDGGVNDNDLIVIGGRPGMGKTQVSLAIGRHFALNKRQGVAYFSIEMPAYQLLHRMTAMVSGVSESKAKHAMTDQEYTLWGDGMKQLVDSPFRVHESAKVSLDTIKQQCRMMKRENNELGCIIIDYLQLMHIAFTHQNYVRDIGEVTKGLKLLAREISTPIFLLSQLNRSLEGRPDKRPVESDLRDSGSIEQDADAIMFVYRDAKYNEDSPYGDICELILRKSRHARTGTYYYRPKQYGIESVSDAEIQRIKQANDRSGGKKYKSSDTDEF